MSDALRSSTPVRASAMRVLAVEIDSADGVANAAIGEAAERLADLHHLLARCLPIVQAHCEAEHMLDGFGPRRPRASDALLAHLREECGA